MIEIIGLKQKQGGSKMYSVVTALKEDLACEQQQIENRRESIHFYKKNISQNKKLISNGIEKINAIREAIEILSKHK